MLHQAVHVVTTDLNGLMDPYLHTLQSSSPKEALLCHIATMEQTLCTNRLAPVTALEMIRYIHASLQGYNPKI